MEDPLGAHYIIEMYGCDSVVLRDTAKIEQSLLKAAEISGATIINSNFHEFSPYGVSGVVVIAESHLSIHTWPEYGYAAFDFFTCNRSMEMEPAFEMLRKVFRPEHMETHCLRRGILNPAERQKNSLLYQKKNFTQAVR